MELMESSNRRIVECVELSNRRIVERWRGGIGGAVESSNGSGMVSCRIVEWWNVGVVDSSNRQIFELWSWWSCRIVESSHGGTVELVELSIRRIVN